MVLLLAEDAKGLRCFHDHALLENASLDVPL